MSLTEHKHPHSELGLTNLLGLQTLCASASKGNFAEVGVYRGGSAWRLYQVAYDRGCDLHLFDTFEGMPESTPGLDYFGLGAFNKTSLEEVKQWMPNAKFHVGFFPDTLDETVKNLSFVHIDCDQYATCKAAIEKLWPLMVEGGIMAFDDWGFPGIQKAVKECSYTGDVFMTPQLIPYFVKGKS